MAKTTKTTTKKTTAKVTEPKQVKTEPKQSEAYARLKELAQLHPTSTPATLKLFAQNDAEVVEILDKYIDKGLGNELVEF